MKKIGLLLVLMLIMVGTSGSLAAGELDLLGGFSMDDATVMLNEQFGKQIIGSYDNTNKSDDELQLHGWYTFSIPKTGACIIRAKAYKGLVTELEILDSNGQRMEKEYFTPNEGWKTFRFNALKDEQYYLHFRRGVDLTWACTFSVCVEGIHKANANETTIQQATCTQSGTTGHQCELCGEYMISGTIPAKGHQPGIERILKEANCLQKGEKGVACSVCSEVMSSTEIPMQGHTPGAFEDAQKATCTTDGVRVQYCKVCNAMLNTEKIAAYGHQSGEWRTAVYESCYQAGRREKNCTICGATLAVEEIPQNEHQYSEWKTILEPTKEAEGEEGRICILCGDMQINKIPKIAKFLGIF